MGLPPRGLTTGKRVLTISRMLLPTSNNGFSWEVSIAEGERIADGGQVLSGFRALREEELGGGDGLPYMALGVLRGVDQ